MARRIILKMGDPTLRKTSDIEKFDDRLDTAYDMHETMCFYQGMDWRRSSRSAKRACIVETEDQLYELSIRFTKTSGQLIDNEVACL